MKGSLTTSAIVHASLLAFALVSLGSPEPLDVSQAEALPVELVPIEELSQIQQGDKNAPKAEKSAPVPTTRPDIIPNAQNIGNNVADIEAPPTPTTKPNDNIAAAAPPKQEKPQPVVDTKANEVKEIVKEETSAPKPQEMAALPQTKPEIAPQPKPEPPPQETKAEEPPPATQEPAEIPVPQNVPRPNSRPEPPKQAETKPAEQKPAEKPAERSRTRQSPPTSLPTRSRARRSRKLRNPLRQGKRFQRRRCCCAVEQASPFRWRGEAIDTDGVARWEKIDRWLDAQPDGNGCASRRDPEELADHSRHGGCR